jgi:Flp pilus assembly protein TadD
LDTLTIRNNLATTLGSQGKNAEADRMNKKTLVLREKVSGKEHHCTFAGMNGLAAAQSHEGKYVEAVQIFREALALEEKVLGKEHPDTLITINDLATVLIYQREEAEVE